MSIRRIIATAADRLDGQGDTPAPGLDALHAIRRAADQHGATPQDREAALEYGLRTLGQPGTRPASQWATRLRA